MARKFGPLQSLRPYVPLLQSGPASVALPLSQQKLFSVCGYATTNVNTFLQYPSMVPSSEKLSSLIHFTQYQRKHDWNRAVSDAEKIVGYPTSYLTLRSLFSDEMSNMAVHLRKLVGTSHPLLKTAKKLIYNGKNNMQTRGLIILLLSKATGHLNSELITQNLPEGVSLSQRSLAEISEMIHTAHLIHKGVVNLSSSMFPDGASLNDMTFGNKIAILSGDYLLANACTGLAALNNSKVVELISSAISDFIEAEFIGKHDPQDNSLPSEKITIEDWEAKNVLATGSLLARSCQGAVLLAGHDEEKQMRAFDFGKYIALAWQVHCDLQPFVDGYRHPPGSHFDLTSAPVILHIQKETQDSSSSDALSIINGLEGSVDNCDFESLYNIISKGPGIQDAKNLCHMYADSALDVLRELEESDARTALENIVQALRED